MKRLLIIILIIVWSCSNERIVQLPKINSSEIAQVLDVSPAYIFYDETEQDSVLFNRKNLIGTTNWLVNVDRRLKLRQVVPHLVYLQNKRQSGGMHTNEDARNYFTCNNTATNNLGFIDYTQTHMEILDELPIQNDTSAYFLLVKEANDLELVHNKVRSKVSRAYIVNKVDSLKNTYPSDLKFYPVFNMKLSFQEYINVKQVLNEVFVTTGVSLNQEKFLNLNSLN